MQRRDEPGDIDANDFDHAQDGQNRQRVQMGLAANQILTDKGISFQRSNRGKLTRLQRKRSHCLNSFFYFFV